MPRVIFQVSDREKALWVEAAFGERLSLSEWLRRAANVRLGGLVAGEGAGHSSPPEISRAERSVVPPAPATRPPSALDAESPAATQGVRVGKASFRPDPKKGK